MITLKNTGGRCQCFVLTHEAYCEARGECACRAAQGRPPRRVSRSLTLATGVTSPALHEAVLSVPEVSRALRRGTLLAERAEQPAAVPTEPTESSSPEAAARPHTAPTIPETATAAELESTPLVGVEPAVAAEPESVGDAAKPSESHPKKKRGSQ